MNTFGPSAYKPYGDGSSSTYSPIIALGESWAYYMGHFLADKTYGTNGSCQNEQDGGINWCSSTVGSTGHPHLDVEENFNPNLTVDKFEWIPQGLFYDLFDPANETLIDEAPLNDQVSSYTNSQMFNAFKSNIYTLHDYRVKLLQQTTNTTSGNVPDLFSQYHYQ